MVQGQLPGKKAAKIGVRSKAGYPKGLIRERKGRKGKKRMAGIKICRKDRAFPNCKRCRNLRELRRAVKNRGRRSWKIKNEKV